MGSLGVHETSKKTAMWFYPKALGFHPSERWGHSACYSHGLIYIFGGCCGGLHFGDVLVLNPDTMSWSTLATTGQGPGLRDSHSAVFVGRRMFVFGGTNGSKKVNDLHVLDLVTREWTRPECKGTPPCPRESHTATLIGDDRIMIFGGSGEGEGNYLNDLHVLDIKTMRWSSPQVKGNVPVPRDSHGAAAIGNEFFVYGGDRGDRYHGDVDVLDADTMTWTKLLVNGSSPGARAGHAAVNIGNKVYIIGGVGDKHYYNDVWILDVTACSWTRLDVCGQQPQGRFSHTAVVTGSDIAIYGGCGEDERPSKELLILQLGAVLTDRSYTVSTGNFFGRHWNQDMRTSPPGAGNNKRTLPLGNREPELESKRASWFSPDNSNAKRKRTANLKSWEFESEQEEHSLSLSQHSSPSQSDQEQTPVIKSSDSITASQELNLFKQLNPSPSNFLPIDVSSYQKEPRSTDQRSPCVRIVHTGGQGFSSPAMEEKPKDSGFAQNLIGAEVSGRVDGAFDSGLLMTATVKGKIFRGVLFAPVHEVAVSREVIPSQYPSNHNINAHPFSSSNHIEPLKISRQPSRIPVPESGQSFRKTQTNIRTSPLVRSSPSLTKEPKLRNDLQGVVLTLAGPGSAHL